MYAVLIVTIIGIICIVVSFMLVNREELNRQEEDAAKETPSRYRITDDYELDEEELDLLQHKVSDKISQDVNDIIYSAENSLSTLTNEKMMALGDYAVTVCDEIEKNHKEVMFLYSMLNDKEKELKRLVTEADERAADLKKASELVMETYGSGALELEDMEEPESEEDKTDMEETEEHSTPTEDNSNDIILEMKRNGMSMIEIARELGLGVGEVKLVIDLYQGDKR